MKLECKITAQELNIWGFGRDGISRMVVTVAVEPLNHITQNPPLFRIAEPMPPKLMEDLSAFIEKAIARALDELEGTSAEEGK